MQGRVRNLRHSVDVFPGGNTRSRTQAVRGTEFLTRGHKTVFLLSAGFRQAPAGLPN